jgi:hypothetical protein
VISNGTCNSATEPTGGLFLTKTQLRSTQLHNYRKNYCLSWKCSENFELCSMVATSRFTSITKISPIPRSTRNASYAGGSTLKNMVLSLSISRVPTTALLIF